MAHLLQRGLFRAANDSYREWLATKQTVTSLEYAAAMRLPNRTALNHLKHLTELRLVRKLGSGIATRYEVLGPCVAKVRTAFPCQISRQNGGIPGTQRYKRESNAPPESRHQSRHDVAIISTARRSPSRREAGKFWPIPDYSRLTRHPSFRPARGGLQPTGLARALLKSVAETKIPDDWKIVEHPAGIPVLKIGGKYVDLDIAPIATASLDENATWTDEDGVLINRVLDALTDMDSELTIQHRH